MLRTILLFTGLFLLFIQEYIQPIAVDGQFIIFLVGVIFLGIPHGASDLLVATQNAERNKQSFSRLKFFTTYLSWLISFGLLLFFFPVAGAVLFILFAAYHFGETDLYNIRTNHFLGKLLVISYGLVILSVIVVSNIQDLRQLFKMYGTITGIPSIIHWVETYHYFILSFSVFSFFCAVFFYFLLAAKEDRISDSFLWEFALLIFILYNLPLLLGFTFYFVFWHSVLSLRNIFFYLRLDDGFSLIKIVKQITFFSALAFSGFLLSGAFGYIFFNNQAILIYIFFGLAVLTAPHMQIMYDMYNKLRKLR